MNSLDQLLEGIAILRKYFNDDRVQFGCTHEQFDIAATDVPVTEADQSRLRELCWTQDEVGDGEPYDPDEGWAFYC